MMPASELIGKPPNDVLVALDWKNLVTRFGEIAHGSDAAEILPSG